MKVCIVYPYVRWLLGRPCGGAEKQVGLLAQHLVRRGQEVTFLAPGYRGQETEACGVHIRKAWDDHAGIPWLRAVTHRLPSIKRLVSEIDADLYYVRGAQAVSRWVVAGAHEREALTFLGLASDRNLLPECGRMIAPLGHTPFGALTGRLAWQFLQLPALRTADLVVAQNEEQAERCGQMGLRHVLIPNIVEAPPAQLLQSQATYDVVWVANLPAAAGRRKGIEPLLTLVRSLPEARFAVVGTLTHHSLSAVLSELKQARNVDVIGTLGYEQTQAVIAASRLVLNTSPIEGFSNVMLEGWSLAKPSVTLSVNPSGLLADGRWPSCDDERPDFTESLGACAGGDLAALSRLIREALADETGLRGVGRRCQRYVTEVHDPDVVCARYEELAASMRYAARKELPIPVENA